ncbi:MAG: NAD(P)/FAD-dependent oxidoreductase [Candidatus Altiarchaeales archaeon]|nr:NAD(P)/FAD-dependent oxidoreductase [Candidatus Altiarchaeales archaeon]
MEYELVIVGAGPAGLSAALTAAYYKLKTLVLESGTAGGALTNKYPWKSVDQVLGQPHLLGYQVAKNMVEHVKLEGVEIKENETVLKIAKKDKQINVETTRGLHACKAVVLAIGLGIPKKLEIPGENLAGVLYSLSNPKDFKGKRVLVVGGGDTALESAVILAENNAEVTLIHRSDSYRASEKNCKKLAESRVECMLNRELSEIKGEGKVERAVVFSNKTNDRLEMEFDCILLSLGTTSNKKFLEDIGVKADDKGNVVVDRLLRTNIEGVFAAGDVTGKWLRIPNAIGEGGFAALNAYKYVKNPYWA